LGQELDVNIQRTQRVADLMRKVREQPGQQQLLLLGRQLADVLTQCLRKDLLHGFGGSAAAVERPPEDPRPYAPWHRSSRRPSLPAPERKGASPEASPPGAPGSLPTLRIRGFSLYFDRL